MELEKLKAIAAGVLGLSPAEISETADFSEVYGADSLEVFRIVTAIEEEQTQSHARSSSDCAVNIAQHYLAAALGGHLGYDAFPHRLVRRLALVA